ncbi:MAG: glucokinase [Sphingomonadaceae bacterium]
MAGKAPTAVLAADIGGTHARFAIASRGADGIRLAAERKLRVADFTSLETALNAYRAEAGELPARAVMAVAAPTEGDVLRFTNNSWVLRPAVLAARLGLESVRLINDFAAVAHGVAVLPDEALPHLAGPDVPLPQAGVVTVAGPGTGLGVAMLLRQDGQVHVLPTEGGHMDFAPLDPLEDRLLARLRGPLRRVSVERVVAGPGLATIREALAAFEGRAAAPMDDHALWEAAVAGTDMLARAALDRWCLSLGSVLGDLALAHWARGVVLAGGIVPRIRPILAESGFHARFVAKGRFAQHMASLPIRTIAHPEPGLLGAAAAGLSPERPDS